MEMSVQQFLDSVSNPHTKKEYRHGLKKFCEWFGKSAEEVLEMRKDDLTQRAGENLIDYRNRAARFEKEIEKFHSYLLESYSINTARNWTLGIRQLFRFYEMPIRFRAGSRIAKTVKTTKNFPLNIEHIRAMFKVADLRERVILSMATDLGLRIGDFIKIKKDDLPPLDQEPPISFDLMTSKEDVIAHCFLSHETVDLLKAYLPTLEKKNGNPYLFPSNSASHISDEWLNRLLQRLAENAKINLNGKNLTFHCFRKMFLSAAIDSGIGLTAGKKLCGKAIAESDDTYLTTVKLKEKFSQLKRFFTIKEQPKAEVEKIETLKKAIVKLQEEMTQQRMITETVSEENVKTKKEIEKLQPLMKFVESLKNQNDALRLYLSAWASQLPEEKLTEEEGMKAAEISDRINIELAKTIRKALDLGLERLTKDQEQQTK
ncbi:MAG: site-specific integrase [Candidatus Bathyarchaeota archaeon]|nr:site-specific integrase [Candidatus Bathyarchaeota archaeon]